MGRFEVFLAVFLILLNSPYGIEKFKVEAVFPCHKIYGELSSCVAYVGGDEASPSTTCCQGMRNVTQSYGGTHNGRESVCDCFVSLLPLIGSVNGNLVSALPQQCGMDITLPPISPHFNCSRVN